MPEMMDYLSFRPYGSGECKRCGKYSDELLLATLTSGDTSQSMEMCRECAAVLKQRVDARNARISRQQNAPEQAQEPSTETPPKQQKGASGVKIVLLVLAVLGLAVCAALFFLWDRIQPPAEPEETTTSAYVFEQPEVTDPVQPLEYVRRSGEGGLINANGFCGIKSDGTLSVSFFGEEDADYYSGLLFWSDLVAVDWDGDTYFGLKKDGTVLAVGEDAERYDFTGWTDIAAISAGADFVVGLKSDGTVVATGENNYGQCNVSDWTDIVAVAAGGDFTVGLRPDGRLVWTLAGNEEADLYKPDILALTDVAAISAAKEDNIVVLKKDGTVVSVAPDDSDEKQSRDVSGWTNIVAISNGDDYIVGLKADGTVVATGNNDKGQCNVSEWTDIVATSASDYDYTVGLRRDGTVVTTLTGEEDTDAVLRQMSEWTDMMLPAEYR